MPEQAKAEGQHAPALFLWPWKPPVSFIDGETLRCWLIESNKAAKAQLLANESLSEEQGMKA